MSDDETEAGGSTRKRRQRRSRRALRVPVDEVPRRSVAAPPPTSTPPVSLASIPPAAPVPLLDAQSSSHPPPIATIEERVTVPTGPPAAPPPVEASDDDAEEIDVQLSGESKLDSGEIEGTPTPEPAIAIRKSGPSPKDRSAPPPAPRAALTSEPAKAKKPSEKPADKIDRPAARPSERAKPAPKVSEKPATEKPAEKPATERPAAEKPAAKKPSSRPPRVEDELETVELERPDRGTPSYEELRAAIVPAPAAVPRDFGVGSAAPAPSPFEPPAEPAPEPARTSDRPSGGVVVRGTVRVSDPAPAPTPEMARAGTSERSPAKSAVPLERYVPLEEDERGEVTVEMPVPTDEVELLRAALDAPSVQDEPDEPEVTVSAETHLEDEDELDDEDDELDELDDDDDYDEDAEPRTNLSSDVPTIAEAPALDPSLLMRDGEAVTVDLGPVEDSEEVEVDVEVKHETMPPVDLDVEVEDEPLRSAPPQSEENLDDLDLHEVEEYPTVPEAKALRRDLAKREVPEEDAVDLDDIGGEERISDPGPPPAAAPRDETAFANRSSGEHKKPPVAPPAAPPAKPQRGEAQTAAREGRNLDDTRDAKAKRRGKTWFEEFFNDDYLRTVRSPLPEDVARECDFIEYVLGLEQGATILDVGCGLGLHAVELTARGYLVVGLDLSLPMLSRAADEAQDRGVRINFLHADMREVGFTGAFDAILCWGTTFGYFDDEGNRDVIQKLFGALKPMGLLLLDVVNRDYVVRSQPNLVWFEGDGCVCMEETQFNYITSRLEVKRTVILDDGRQRESQYSIRLYALHELGVVLHKQGFRVAEVTGRIATPGVFFGADSPRMIILAERRLDRKDGEDEPSDD